MVVCRSVSRIAQVIKKERLTMELIDSLNQVKEDLQHSVDNLNKVKEDLYEQLHTTVAVGPYDEEEVYNSVDPILSDNSMDELEGIAERVGEVFNEIGEIYLRGSEIYLIQTHLRASKRRVIMEGRYESYLHLNHHLLRKNTWQVLIMKN